MKIASGVLVLTVRKDVEVMPIVRKPTLSVGQTTQEGLTDVVATQMITAGSGIFVTQDLHPDAPPHQEKFC